MVCLQAFLISFFLPPEEIVHAAALLSPCLSHPPELWQGCLCTSSKKKLQTVQSSLMGWHRRCYTTRVGAPNASACLWWSLSHTGSEMQSEAGYGLGCRQGLNMACLLQWQLPGGCGNNRRLEKRSCEVGAFVSFLQ